MMTLRTSSHFSRSSAESQKKSIDSPVSNRIRKLFFTEQEAISSSDAVVADPTLMLEEGLTNDKAFPSLGNDGGGGGVINTDDEDDDDDDDAVNGSFSAPLLRSEMMVVVELTTRLSAVMLIALERSITVLGACIVSVYEKSRHPRRL